MILNNIKAMVLIKRMVILRGHLLMVSLLMGNQAKKINKKAYMIVFLEIGKIIIKTNTLELKLKRSQEKKISMHRKPFLIIKIFNKRIKKKYLLI